jgi:L-asparaginase
MNYKKYFFTFLILCKMPMSYPSTQKNTSKIVPKIVIHGGIKNFEGNLSNAKIYFEKLKQIIEKTYRILEKTDARTAAVEGIKLLENDPIFNAGTGSRFQRDGKIRMSASLMSGKKHKFAGVINITDVKNPIEIVNLLYDRKHSVLSGRLATKFARKKKFPLYDPTTPERLKEYQEKKFSKTGTVGIVVLDAKGEIWAGTSTGGTGYETPGRVGDTPTIAGNYASKNAGVSCTGRGEHIRNLGVATKVVTRIDDGMNIKDAVEKIIKEGDTSQSLFGLISLDKNGIIKIGQTKGATVLFATHDGTTLTTFFDNVIK